MDKDALVENGRTLIGELKSRNMAVTGAVWVHFIEPDRWRLYLAVPSLEQDGAAKVYTIIRETLRQTGSQLAPDFVSVVGPNDPYMRELQRKAAPKKEPVDYAPMSVSSSSSAISSLPIDWAIVYPKNT